VIEGYPAPVREPGKWQWSKRDGVFSIEKLRANETAMLVGNEFDGWASKHVFSLTHLAKWSWFLEDQQVRSKLRNVCSHAASALGSNQIVYVPSGFLKPEGVRSLMYEGKTAEEMIDWLYQNCGQPAQSFESIEPKTLRTSTTSTNPPIQVLGVDFRGGLQGKWAAVSPGTQPQTRRQFRQLY
jgi:hypothetical protein